MVSRFVAGLFIAGTSLGLCTIVAAQDRPPDVQEGVQVQTRGPVHEAFAETVSFNPEPGLVVSKAPPPQIEEVPPDERPEGANVAWIPGYWAWDDERNDFLWVSGVWRVMPPDREWVPGYWGQIGGGFQWMSGYWADSHVNETVYLPEPPDSVEAGPNVAQPSPNHIWAPGCWVWHEGRYAWRPGYWVAVQPEWMWVPSYYVYSPRGYVFCEGYWDYQVESRGVLYAPVYFEPGVYARPSFHYSPLIAINLSVFFDHLFVRPSCHHYYFGDYYEPRYYDQGIYASFSFNFSSYGYDPIHVHERYVHRDDRDWDHHVRETFLYRREHEEARPPRTLAIQVNVNAARKDKPVDRTLVIAAPLEQVTKNKEHPIKLQQVAKEEKVAYAKSERDVESARGERKAIEAAAPGRTVSQPSEKSEPGKADKPGGPPDKAGRTERPDNKPDGKPDNKPDGKPDNKPDGKPDGKPDNRPDNKPDGKPVNRPDNKPDAKPEGRPEKAATPASQPTGGPDAARKPDQAKRPKPPIPARPADQQDKAKAPPKRPEPPPPDPKVESKPRKAGGRPDPPQAQPKASPREAPKEAPKESPRQDPKDKDKDKDKPREKP